MKTLTTLLLTLLVLGGCSQEETINVLTIYPDKNTYLISKNYEGISSLKYCRKMAKQLIAERGYENAEYECGMNCSKRTDLGGLYECKEDSK